MTNEQIIKGLTKMLDDTIEANECGLSNNDFKDDIELLKSALSLIKAQQEEISKYKTLYERALSDVVKTDKQIDLMADEIIMTKPINCTKTNEFSTKKIYMSKEELKQYFADLVEKE